MKDMESVLDLVKDKNLQKGAAIGAGVGLALSANKSSKVKGAVAGAGLGIAAVWLLDNFVSFEKASETKDQEEINPLSDVGESELK